MRSRLTVMDHRVGMNKVNYYVNVYISDEC